MQIRIEHLNDRPGEEVHEEDGENEQRHEGCCAYTRDHPGNTAPAELQVV
jgi:hypothetical protein